MPYGKVMNPNHLMQCGLFGCIATFLTTYNAAIESACAIVSVTVLIIGAICKFHLDKGDETTQQEKTTTEKPSEQIHEQDL